MKDIDVSMEDIVGDDAVVLSAEGRAIAALKKRVAELEAKVERLEREVDDVDHRTCGLRRTTM